MSGFRFLVVDDDDVDRERLRRLIAVIHPSAAVDEAELGAAALVLAARKPFDCIFVDFRLGDCIGTDLVSELKSRTGRDAPVIMVTGRGDERIAVEAMRVGVYDYIPKHSLNQSLLEAAIQSCLHKTLLQQSLEQANERLRQSMFDSLTGLVGRDLFLDRLVQRINLAQREEGTFAVLLADLNAFKEINDKHGHAAGDAVLTLVAKRLQSAVRASDTVARFGGDEFGMILSGIAAPVVATVVAQKIVKSVNEPILVGGNMVYTGVSLGLVVYPHDGVEAEVLLAHADAAMYRAKHSIRGYEFHADISATPEELLARRVIATIGSAVANDELFLEYQPKISLAGGEVCGIEALVRWQSGELGLLSPGYFIPLAERTSAIVPITYRVLELALQQAKRWRKHGIHIPVAVNISACLLEDDALLTRLNALLSRFDVPGSMVIAEFTETALANSSDKSRRTLKELTALGVKTSIDDFGTGYTSLRNLKELDIGEIKIDNTFVSQLSQGGRDEAVIRTVIALAQNFNVPVVAEGIEEVSSIAQLRELGCTHGQGFHISRPMLGEALPAWLIPHRAAMVRSIYA